MRTYYVTWLLIIGIVAALWFCYKQSDTALKFMAIGECQKWQQWADQFPPWDESTQTGYYITSWQSEECDTVGIHITAPVIDHE